MAQTYAAADLTFSVLIPCYNYAHFLPRAIDSVLAQSFSDYEIIVIDDGSTDATWKVIGEYGDRVRGVTGANVGQARACLRGARMARGRYIHILDADDRLHSDCLEKVAAMLSGAPAKVQFPLHPIDRDGNSIGRPFPRFPQAYPRARILKEITSNGSYITSPTSGIVFRADVWAAIDDVDYERAQDGVAYLLSPYLGDVVSLQNALGDYCIHDNNNSQFHAPTIMRFSQERSRFVARLKHLKAICKRLNLSSAGVPDGEKMAYVLERRILEQVCQGERIELRFAFKFLRRLFRTRSPAPRKLALAVWTAGCALAPASFLKTLMQWRYNPWSRPPLFRRLTEALR